MIDIFFNKKEILKEDGITVFNDLFFNTEEEIDIVKCPLLTKAECESDEFWKEVYCGTDSLSPEYLLFIKTGKEYRDSYPTSGGCTKEFQFLIDVIQNILGINTSIDIFRKMDYFNNLIKGTVELNQNSEPNENPESITISSSENDNVDFHSMMIAIPRKLDVDAEWNTLPKLLRDKYIYSRTDKVFNY